MKTKLKQSVKKVLSFMLAVAMVITSFTLPSMTVKAEDEASYTLYFKLPDNTTAADWAFNLHSGNLVKANNDVKFRPTTWGDGDEYPTLLSDDNLAGWGYVEISGDISGFQFVKKDGTEYKCWNKEIANQHLTKAYYVPADECWYKEAECKNKIEEPVSMNYKLYFKLPEETTVADWAFNLHSGKLVSANYDVKFRPTTWGDGDEYPTLLSDDNLAGWGYVEISGDISGFQFVKKDGTEYKCWDPEIATQELATAYYDTATRKWYKDSACTEKVNTKSTAISNPEATKMKLYIKLSAFEGDKAKPENWGFNIWNDSVSTLTEAGEKIAPTAWGGKQINSLLDAGDGWAYVGLDGTDITGLNFTYVQSEPDYQAWNAAIKSLEPVDGIVEAYYDIKTSSWYKTKECKLTDIIKEKKVLEDYYIVGGAEKKADNKADASLLGSWKSKNAIKMNKTEDGYTVTIPMTAGDYQFLVIQDAPNFDFKYKFADYNKNWANYAFTVNAVDGVKKDVTFVVKNPDRSTGKADVSVQIYYTVTFKDGEKVLDTKNILAGQAATAPAAPAKTGYTFDGWDASFDAVTADLTVNAKWKTKAVTPVTKTYKVVFKNGKTVVATQTITSGKAAKAPKLTKKGYTLSWDKSFKKVTANLTVNAKWKANKYTVSYNVNGGKKLKSKSKSVTYGKTYGKLAAPQRAGYTFAGWYTAKTKGTKITAGSKVAITKKTTLYARWKKVTNPGKVAKPSLKNSSAKAMKVSYKKVKGAAGYEIRYSTKSNMKSAKKVTTKSTSKTIKKLTKGKKYYVQVRAYKLDSAGKKIYSKAQSSKVSLKIKK